MVAILGSTGEGASREARDGPMGPGTGAGGIMGVVISTDRLADRYGRGPRRGPRLLVVYAGIVLLAVIGWFVWILWETMNPPLGSQMQNYRMLDENTVEVTFQVNVYDDGVIPVCSVEAEDAHEMKVGELLEHRAEPGRQTVTFETEREAARVEWGGCTDNGSGEPH